MRAIDRLGREIMSGDICAITDATGGSINIGKAEYVNHNNNAEFKLFHRRGNSYTVESLCIQDLKKTPDGSWVECRTTNKRVLILQKAKR